MFLDLGLGLFKERYYLLVKICCIIIYLKEMFYVIIINNYKICRLFKGNCNLKEVQKGYSISLLFFIFSYFQYIC